MSSVKVVRVWPGTNQVAEIAASFEQRQEPLRPDPRSEFGMAELDRRVAPADGIGDRVVIDRQRDAEAWRLHRAMVAAATHTAGRPLAGHPERPSTPAYLSGTPVIRAAKVGRSGTRTPRTRFATSSWTPIRTTRRREAMRRVLDDPAADAPRGRVAGLLDEALRGWRRIRRRRRPSSPGRRRCGRRSSGAPRSPRPT